VCFLRPYVSEEPRHTKGIPLAVIRVAELCSQTREALLSSQSCSFLAIAKIRYRLPSSIFYQICIESGVSRLPQMKEERKDAVLGIWRTSSTVFASRHSLSVLQVEHLASASVAKHGHPFTSQVVGQVVDLQYVACSGTLRQVHSL